MSRRHIPRNRWRIVVLGAALAVVLAGCGSGEDDSSEVASLGDGGDGTATAEAGSKDREEAFTEYSRCMRENGVPDFPDPTVDSEGNVRMGGMRDLDTDDPTVAAALDTCEPLIQNVRQDYDPDKRQDRDDALLAYAQCMRENGYPMDDPDLEASGPGSGGPFGDLDRNDPKYQEADDICRPETLGDGGMGGGGGGGGAGS